MTENDRYRILTGEEFINYTKHNNFEDNTIKHGYLGDFGDTIDKIRELPGEKSIQIETYDQHNPHIDWIKFEQLESMNEMAQVINNMGKDPNFKVTVSDTATITVIFETI